MPRDADLVRTIRRRRPDAGHAAAGAAADGTGGADPGGREVQVLPLAGDARTQGDFCTHRDVLPFAGKEGFKPDSWCPECAFYKLRRTPKKRERIDYSY